MKFNYRPHRDKKDSLHAPPSYRPVIPARIIGLRSSAVVSGLLDTGSEATLFDESYISLLDVHIKAGDEEVFQAADGTRFLVSFGMIDIELATPRRRTVHRWSARVGFMKRPKGAGSLFGHEGFLEYFSASFHGPELRVTLTPIPPLPLACMPVK